MNGTQHGFERIGQDRVTTEATALHLPSAQPQPVAETEVRGDLRQRTTVHQRGAVAAQLAFIGVRVGVVKSHRYDQREHGIAEELESLVVGPAGAAMRERGVEQRRVPESIPEPGFGPDRRRPVQVAPIA